MSGFEPFFDYEEINEEMSSDLKKSLEVFRKAQDDLVAAKTPDRGIVCARRLLEAQNKLSLIARAINETIYTVPVMVHEAGKVKTETESDGTSFRVQRCDRCGSELIAADDDDSGDFFDVGNQIAKSSVSKKINPKNRREMYYIGDRDLRKHEFECISLKNIFEEFK